MFILYIEVINEHLILDLKRVVLGYLCIGLQRLLEHYRRILHPFDFGYRYHVTNDLSTYRRHCSDCIQYHCDPSDYRYIVGTIDPTQPRETQLYYLICSQCKYLNIPTEDYRRYKPFLILVHPRLDIDIK